MRSISVAVAAIASLSACNFHFEDSYESQYLASVGDITAQNRALRAVPFPTHRVTVSVYGMPDLTGQYKESTTGQNLSRAVTQGGAAVLIKALQDAGDRRWFSVLDRSNLDNLVRERQIITEMRRIYRGEQNISPSVLGPLDHSGILIDGAIVGYDTNTVTGGVGARYLGIGANRRYKIDVVTVSLKAVSVETSEVLASVVVRKPLASISEQGNIFTYVALDEILEGEAGRAVNEPKQIAVEQAVEKAVMALIAEGSMAGIWSFADTSAGQAYVTGYVGQKFDGNVPATGASPARPDTTASATRIPETVPARRRARAVAPVIERRLEPAAPAVQTPAPRLPPDTPHAADVVG
ncbi:CsgG/HfaB family protein [Jannaschia sp. KMU-145]|uniref:CsgG/HfaB family protein n=1 Tax=Jannaschia halovivens TaxID=3388667 RepID=UPI00396B1EAB